MPWPVTVLVPQNLTKHNRSDVCIRLVLRDMFCTASVAAGRVQVAWR